MKNEEFICGKCHCANGRFFNCWYGCLCSDCVSDTEKEVDCFLHWELCTRELMIPWLVLHEKPAQDIKIKYIIAMDIAKKSGNKPLVEELLERAAALRLN